jgi:hypothetical protein
MGGIDVMFDDVEGEVIEPAEGPDDKREKGGGFEIGMLGEEDGGSEEAEKEKEDPFELYPAGIGKVFHKISVTAPAWSG